MFTEDVRRTIEHITSGTRLEGQSDNCTATRNFLSGRYQTSRTVKEDFEGKSIIKKEQAAQLEEFCKDQNLWLSDLPDPTTYLTRGGEARIYLDTDLRHVLKCNDAVYYATGWSF